MEDAEDGNKKRKVREMHSVEKKRL